MTRTAVTSCNKMAYYCTMNVKLTLYSKWHRPALGQIRLRLNFFKNKETQITESVETYMNNTSVYV
jgi:hypothetical protein